jgi:hypothetical protein
MSTHKILEAFWGVGIVCKVKIISRFGDIEDRVGIKAFGKL